MTDKKDENTNNTKTESVVCPIISMICFLICALLMKWGTEPWLSNETGLNIVLYAFLFGFGGFFFWLLS